jgi:hypothetical protein
MLQNILDDPNCDDAHMMWRVRLVTNRIKDVVAEAKARGEL